MTEPLFRQDAYLQHCEARVLDATAEAVVLDRTVFYPLGGGQPGDRGMLVLADGRQLAVADTRYGDAGGIVHYLAEPADALLTGETVTARIDWQRRYAHMRYHTCLHLLCAVVTAPVTGGRISHDKAHLDFDIDMAALDAATIENRLNALVVTDAAVEPGEITDAELDADPDLVRTLSVQPPRGQGVVRTIRIADIDLQPCGGTHLRRTSEVGRVRVARIRSEGKRNKRVTLVLEAPAAS